MSRLIEGNESLCNENGFEVNVLYEAKVINDLVPESERDIVETELTLVELVIDGVGFTVDLAKMSDRTKQNITDKLEYKYYSWAK